MQITVKLPRGNYNLVEDFKTSDNLSVFTEKILNALWELAPDARYKSRLTYYSEITVRLQELVEAGLMKRKEWEKIIKNLCNYYLEYSLDYE